MKILQVITHFDVGGAEKVALNIVKSKSFGIQYFVIEVVYADTEYTKEILRELDVECIRYFRSNVSSTKKAILTFPIRMKRVFDEINPDVVQVHTETPDLAMYLFHKLYPSYKFKLVRTLHNTVLWQSWGWVGRIVEHYIKAEKANVSNSLAVTDAYVKKFGKDDNITLIYNGFATQKQLPYAGIKEGKVNVLFAGRFVPQKGIDVLVKVIQKCKNQNIHFHVAGQGEFAQMVQESLRKIENVTISGPITNLSKYVGAFDYVIITSVHEGLNSLSIEASFNGTPCIINDIDGLNETLPKDWPLKVVGNNVQQYLDILENIESLNHTMLCKKAHDFVDEHFSMAKMQSEYEKLYRHKTS